jgi:hypothetical protein
MNAAIRRVFASSPFIKWIVVASVIAFASMKKACAQEDITRKPTGRQSDNNTEQHRAWQLGGVFVGGFPLNDVEQEGGGIHFHKTLELFNAGFEAGRMLTASHGPGFLRGRGEAVVEVIPFWLAHYPAQEDVVYDPRNEYPGRDGFSEFNNHGISLTPLLFRWNFMKHETSRFVPWVQLGSGLLWTSEPFPFGNGPGAYTSRINFTPQVDLGESIFTKKNQSLNLAVKVIHISSAGLGEYNPGIPVSLQFSVGYSLCMVSRRRSPFPYCMEVLSSRPMPKTSGRFNSAVRAATPPSEDPPTPVCSRPFLTR